jgi:hypothetical protein
VFAADKKFKSLAENDLEERTLASPAVADGAFFLRSESHLWRIGEPMNVPDAESARTAAGVK